MSNTQEKTVPPPRDPEQDKRKQMDGWMDETGFVYTLPQSALDTLIEIQKALKDTLAENAILKDGANSAREHIKVLMNSKSSMQTKLDEYELQVKKLNEAQEKPSDLELEVKSLKEQLQHRDSEILNLKQEREILSTKPQGLQKDQTTLLETLLNEATRREKLEQEENKKLLDEQTVVYGRKETHKNLLEMQNFQVAQSNMENDCNKIKKLLKQKEEIEKKLVKAKEKEAKKQLKKQKEEEMKLQKIQEKEAKKLQKIQEKEAKEAQKQEQNLSWTSCLVALLFTSG